MAELAILGGSVLVDVDDLSLLAGYRWRVFNDGRGHIYARAYADSKTIRMHRMILGTPSGYETDHINGDGLDNRRANLRVATRTQNGSNRHSWSSKSGFKCVYARGSRWYAQIGKERKNLGSFATAEDAARAYDRAALARYGEFAALNFPAAEADTP